MNGCKSFISPSHVKYGRLLRNLRPPPSGQVSGKLTALTGLSQRSAVQIFVAWSSDGARSQSGTLGSTLLLEIVAPGAPFH